MSKEILSIEVTPLDEGSSEVRIVTIEHYTSPERPEELLARLSEGLEGLSGASEAVQDVPGPYAAS